MLAATNIATATMQFIVFMAIVDSKTDSLTIATGFGRSCVRAIEAMNELGSTEFGTARRRPHDTMPELGESPHDFFGYGVFEQQTAIQHDFPARRIGCRLRILPVGGQFAYQVQVSLAVHVFT